MMSSEKFITVGLLWHSLASGNLGVGALTESNISIIRRVAETKGLRVRFLVLGSSAGSVDALADELHAAGHELECHRVRMFRKSFRDLVRRCDVVVDIGEGDSFADIYGFKRFFYYWLSKNIVCSLKKPLVLAPQTIGPFDQTASRVLARQVMARCARVFARDNLSSDYLAQLGVSGNIDEAIDVAFCLPFVRPERTPGGKPKVGINVSGLLFNGGYTGANQFGLAVDYPSTVREIVRYFSENEDVELHLIGHVIEPNMPVEDDVGACRRLAEEFPGAIVAPAFSRPSEAKSYISGMDFFAGARMHACIAAFSAGIPVVPMAYSRKFNGLFGTLGYKRVADCKAEKQNCVVAQVCAGFRDRVDIATEVTKALMEVRRRVVRYESSLAAVLSGRLQ
ncbi:MAG: polysaccharide pyruvyl transferase family protein [Proteobacteria bacterium]|nr:MAG: polysaccharide pyruvyl transferase family protein [Pseudomonadota bacterium]